MGAGLAPSQPVLSSQCVRSKPAHSVSVVRITCLPHSNTYVLTAEGIRVAGFYSKLHNRLVRPLLDADKPPAPIPARRALATLEHAVNDYVHNAASLHETCHNVTTPRHQEGRHHEGLLRCRDFARQRWPLTGQPGPVSG